MKTIKVTICEKNLKEIEICCPAYFKLKDCSNYYYKIIDETTSITVYKSCLSMGINMSSICLPQLDNCVECEKHEFYSLFTEVAALLDQETLSKEFS